jgi:hypothetical protein
MKNILLIVSVVCILGTSCTNKKAEGIITYNLSYVLPDSLKSYGAYLPTTAMVYFKGDSVATVQGTDQESTTTITYQPNGYMVALLKSGVKRFQVPYEKNDQAKELPDMSIYDIKKGSQTKTIGTYKAEQYIVKNKFSGDTAHAWFTHNLVVPPGFLTMVFKPELGTPLIFSTDQNGLITRFSLKAVRFEPVPAGIFNIPQGYQKLTPRELRDMPVGN